MLEKLVLGLGACLLAGCAAPAAVNPAAARSGTGCWVEVFAHEQFLPPMTTYTGPSYQPAPKDARSLRVGPAARFVGYSEPGLKRRAFELPPGTDVVDLAALDYQRRVRSFEVACQ